MICTHSRFGSPVLAGFISIVQALFFALSSAAPAPSGTTDAPAPQSTACGDIINSCSTYSSSGILKHSTDEGLPDYTFTAKQAYDCLVSVPFNPAVATDFVKYYNDTIQFQTTLAYLRSPPSGYQQPPVDLIQSLDQIQEHINSGAFQNQYEFEATLLNLVYAAHDFHVQLSAGILQAFTFYSPYSLIALSSDGKELPKIYNLDDIALQFSDTSFTASPIQSINGQDAIAFLTDFGAKNVLGFIEANADWNNLMSSFAANIQDDYSTLEGQIELYPGDTITLLYENGTQVSDNWGATYDSIGPTGPLATGGDFYNFFVLGFYPASYDPDTDTPDPCAAQDNTASSSDTSSSTAAASTTTPTPTSWPDSSYPSTADIYQPDLYPVGEGFVTGYFLQNESLAVLSIPTFDMSGNDTQTFSDTVGNFLTGAHAAGMTKVLIDLQYNLGGDTLLAADTYKHFFPSNDTYRGSRLRAQPWADVLGNTFTTYFATNQSPNASVYDELAASDWVATDRLNAATDQNFTSWGEFFGPHSAYGDQFTTVQRENISSPVFDENALGIDIYGAARPATAPQLYDPSNIIILTDGLCTSACAVFVEMMHYGAGVRTVAVGGNPQYGPMQAASGSRGQEIYDADDLDADIAQAISFNASTTSLFPDRSVDMFISYLTFNIRDQIRQNSDTPLQFQYDAADCRIFYTAETFSDYSQLWTYAANSIFSEPNLCVSGSTGFSTTNPNPNPPPQNSNTTQQPFIVTNTTSGIPGLELGSYSPKNVGKFVQPSNSKQACNNHGQGCASGTCDLKTTTGSGTFRGQKITFKSGTCTASNGPNRNLQTKQDEPGEIHGDGYDPKAVARSIETGWDHRK